MFEHFLITRFNLRKSDWITNKKNVAVLTEKWLRNRFQLFEDYCLPSVMAQTNTNFEWLVFFDTDTPKTYKEKISNWERKFSNFKPIYVDSMERFLPRLQSHISENDSEYIITSGLDNDDCLSKHYVQTVQKKFNNQDFLAVDFIDGYTLQISPDFMLGKKLHLYNPFISLIEKNDHPKTVSSVSHRLWKSESRVLQIKDQRVWSSIIHDENKVNEFTGYGEVDWNDFKKDFIISQSAKEKIENHLISHDEWQILSLKNELSSKYIVFSKTLKKKLGFYQKKE